MSNFGFISSLLAVESPFDFLIHLLPEKWRYRHGPLPAGAITGYLSGQRLDGFGWKIPQSAGNLWDETGIFRLWQKFVVELAHKEVGIIGLDSGINFQFPFKLASQKYFPGVSDGKALELLLFLDYFRGILRNYGVSPQRAKALIIWEEGNLGLACARLIAREVRFLTLVNPNIRFLERAADLIMAETGVSPQIYTVPPDLKNDKIVIKCGKLTNLNIIRHSRQVIWCEIFQRNPSLRSLNVDLPVAAVNAHHQLPLYPALGETILRSFFNLPGFWYGPELQLERIIKLADVFKELGVKIAV